MGRNTIGAVYFNKPNAFRWMAIVAIMVQATCLFISTAMAEFEWTPSVGLSAAYDDNIEFVPASETDDYVYLARPRIKIAYNRELTRIDGQGDVIVRKYQENDQFDDEIYNLRLNANTNMSERFSLSGYYRFTKDTTLDSELKEVGRVFTREDRNSHLIGLTPNLDLTERLSIGLDAYYRDVAYDSEIFVDYSFWSIEVPISWLLANEVDTIYINPGYTDIDSDSDRSKTYNLRIGWKHKTTERLSLDLALGVRYTELESTRFGITTQEDNWNGLGSLRLDYIFQTGSFKMGVKRDLTNTAVGEQADVTKVGATLEYYFSERFGMEINGNYWRTVNEFGNQDYTTYLFEAGSELFYKVTKDHDLFIRYLYSHEDDGGDDAEDSIAERNIVIAGLRLRFPMK